MIVLSDRRRKLPVFVLLYIPEYADPLKEVDFSAILTIMIPLGDLF
jgi:hypothetical protein